MFAQLTNLLKEQRQNRFIQDGIILHGFLENVNSDYNLILNPRPTKGVTVTPSDFFPVALKRRKIT